jgi:hypothetical protein
VNVACCCDVPLSCPLPLLQNATTITSKFRDLFGLELALKQELQELNGAQQAAVDELLTLQAACRQPPPALVELAATCSRHGLLLPLACLNVDVPPCSMLAG